MIEQILTISRNTFIESIRQPIYIVLLALLGTAPFLAWAIRPWPMLRNKLVPAIAVAAVGTIVAAMLGAVGWLALTMFFVSLAALAANIIRFVEVGRARLLNTGAAVAHIGFALMLVGIVGSSFWGTGAEAGLPQGQPVDVLGKTYTFVGHVDGSEPKE